MFNLIENHKKLIQIVLAIIFLPFAFFGVDSYFRTGDTSDNVATVDGQPISRQEFTKALQERQTELQRMVGDRFDPALLDNPEIRFSILEGIVRQRLLVNQALRNRVLVSDQQLQELIGDQPAFQENGKFSHTQYEGVLQRQNMTPVMFENSVRRDLMVGRLSDAYRATAMVPVSTVDWLLRINAQQREVSQSVLEPEKFLSQVKLDEGALRQYYDAHQNDFQVPEQARLEYLVLSLDSLAAQTEIAAGEVKQFYEQNLKRYAQGEERQASHILIAVDAKASAQEKQAAREKAEQLLKKIRQNPASFADLAKKSSQDPGSAEKGGDLGYFPRGAMVQPFDDAVFQMKSGELAGPVESPFGYHIIRLAGIKGRGLDDVKQEVERDLRRQKAGKQFSELGEQFRELVFVQGDSLKPASEALKLSLQTSGWVSRDGKGNVKLLNHPKLMQAVFSDDVARNKRNSEIVDVGDNTLVSARVVEYKAPSVRPFDEVSAEIRKRLTTEQAVQLAAKHGREFLTKLKQGAEVSGLTWSASKLVSREKAEGYTGGVLTKVFKADVTALPAYSGVENSQGGFVLLRVSRVVNHDTVDVAKRKAVIEELQRMLGQEELTAYIASLKLKTEVKVRQDRLESKQQ